MSDQYALPPPSHISMHYPPLPFFVVETCWRSKAEQLLFVNFALIKKGVKKHPVLTTGEYLSCQIYFCASEKEFECTCGSGMSNPKIRQACGVFPGDLGASTPKPMRAKNAMFVVLLRIIR